jgi:hypothetical protein
MQLGLIIPNDLKELFRVYNGVLNNYKKGRKGRAPYPPLIEILDRPVRRWELDPKFKDNIDNFVDMPLPEEKQKESENKNERLNKSGDGKTDDEDSSYHGGMDEDDDDIPFVPVRPKSNFVLLIGEKIQYSIADEESTSLFYDTNVGMGSIKTWLDEEIKRIEYDPREYLYEVKLEKIQSLSINDALEEMGLISDKDKLLWRELILQEIERVSNMQLVSTYDQSVDTISIWKDAAELLEKETQNFLVDVFQIAGSYSDKRGSDVINELDFRKAAEELSLVVGEKDHEKDQEKDQEKNQNNHNND